MNNKRKMKSPTETEAPAKKPAGKEHGHHKRDHNPLYSQVAKKDLSIYIRGMTGPLQPENIAEIREKICDKIDEIPSGEYKPTFDRITTFNGLLRLACADERAKMWTEGVVGKMTCADGTALKLAGDPTSFELFKMSVLIFDSANAAPERIIRRFQDQNPGLNTSQWTYFQDVEANSRVPGARCILLGVDQETREFVLSHGRRLHYMLQRVDVVIKNNPGSSATGKDRRKTNSSSTKPGDK